MANAKKGSPLEGKPFPRRQRSCSADKSFESEMKRLRSMSIEERVLEALGMSKRFSWLNPAKKNS